MAASKTSKSQIYHYFRDKEAVISAVIDARTKEVLGFQKTSLAKVETLADLRGWRDQIVAIKCAEGTVGGCPIGSLASELADRSDIAREVLAGSFEEWESYLCATLRSMQKHGELNGAEDAATLATGVIAALQGGLLMAQTKRSTRPLEAALDMALGYLSMQKRSGRDEKKRCTPKPSRVQQGIQP